MWKALVGAADTFTLTPKERFIGLKILSRIGPKNTKGQGKTGYPERGNVLLDLRPYYFSIKRI